MQKFWDSLPPLAKLVLVIIGVILAYLLYKKIATYLRNKKDEFILSNSTQSANINGQPVSVNLGSTAQQIWNAFHDYYGGIAEDEESAIAALNNVPKSLIPELSKIYFQLYTLNLNSEFVKYLSSSDYARVQNLLS